MYIYIRRLVYLTKRITQTKYYKTEWHKEVEKDVPKKSFCCTGKLGQDLAWDHIHKPLA